jgi:cytochrome c biogenesis protein CcdA
MTVFLAGTVLVFVATGAALFFADAFFVAMEPRHERVSTVVLIIIWRKSLIGIWRKKYPYKAP